ncbi:hypothetical protein [Streptomyces sp. DHE17-7]|uniref:hypothetical protein n=1 Tax=Streptomyces sp. DHE17-7 TaxID=2759949 RepID=UPI0022EB17C1|nr:hypothetical protein [Streptomyces sp. DHE17-7]
MQTLTVIASAGAVSIAVLEAADLDLAQPFTAGGFLTMAAALASLLRCRDGRTGLAAWFVTRRNADQDDSAGKMWRTERRRSRAGRLI